MESQTFGYLTPGATAFRNKSQVVIVPIAYNFQLLVPNIHSRSQHIRRVSYLVSFIVNINKTLRAITSVVTISQ